MRMPVYRTMVELEPKRPFGDPTAIHTTAYDRDKHLLPGLLPLTAAEERLFNQGGAKAVHEDRQFRAKEAGDPDWKSK